MLETAVAQFCADYAGSPAFGRRLVIYGENGAGKTHAAKAITRWAQRVAINLPLIHGADGGASLADAEFYNWPAVVSDLKSGQWQIIDEMLPVSLLVLDDIGAEHDPSRCASEKLYLLLEKRERMWTVLTTNYAPETWETKFERRISSRLFRNTLHVPLDKVPDFGSL